jgi:hypothetical protein
MNTEVEELPLTLPVGLASGALPVGRPSGPVGSAGSKREALDVIDEDVAAAAKDEMYRNLAPQRPRTRKPCFYRKQKTPIAKLRAEAAAAAASRKNESFAEYRKGASQHLLDALKDVSGVALLGLLVDPDHDPDDGDLFVSKSQVHRVRQQATGVFNFFRVLNESYPARDQVWCAAEAADRLGCVVSGGTIARWGREFTQVHGFFVDRRGTYERSVFVQEEDVKILVKSWLKDKQNLKHLCRDKFAVYVNKTLIPLVIEGGDDAVAKVTCNT